VVNVRILIALDRCCGEFQLIGEFEALSPSRGAHTSAAEEYGPGEERRYLKCWKKYKQRQYRKVSARIPLLSFPRGIVINLIVSRRGGPCGRPVDAYGINDIFGVFGIAQGQCPHLRKGRPYAVFLKLMTLP